MIPTAEEFFNQYGGYTREDMLERAIDFAKLHVEAALKEASEDADMDNDYYQSVQEGSSGGIDIETILNAYPLENIK